MSQKSGKSSAERRYTSIACLACRKRKVKCNNDRPRCSNCQLYDVDCVFGEDRRRLSMSARLNSNSTPRSPQNSSITTAEGTQRTKVLSPPTEIGPETDTHYFDHFQLENNTFEGQGHLTSMNVTDLAQDWEYWFDTGGSVNIFNSVSPDKTHSNLPAPESAQVISALNSNRDNITPGTSPASLDASSDISNNHRHYSALEKLEGQNSETSKVRSYTITNERLPVLDDVTSQISSRLGRLQIAEDGQPRYYGATSNLHLLHSGTRSLIQPNIRHVATHGDAAIAQAGLQWKEDPAYENLLINLFFSWHNVLMYVVDREIFLRERQRYRMGQTTDYYSPALENAVYTIGAAFTDRTHPAIEDATDEFFGFRTKAYLDIEIDSPTISTAQALLVLSSHEAAHARESRGWIYSGMAVQIITDLGLHLNLELEYSRLDVRDGNDNISTIRRNLFWSTNTIDTLWSAYSGRPSLMKRLIHNAPSPVPSPTYSWEYYTDEYSIMAFPGDFDFRAAAYVHVYLAKLMKILARVSEVLYSGVPDISSDIEAFVAQADRDFQEWLISLPPALHIDCSPNSTAIPLPAVIELHLIFQECVILLHRPLITAADASAASPASEYQAGDVVTGSSFRKCVKAAQQVCRLLVLFRKRYGLRRPHHQMVHVAMTAGLIHIFQLCIFPTTSRENKDAQADFLTCIQALGEMGQTYKSASRALDVVTSLRQSWQHDTFAGDRFKRARLH
ncbi:fungal-specific transcription factor domain-containing protein [Xylogone sp. PMI_703]|nr:fungal-specific transcription factor domain-containing protein [Xylogone sp. PMI_703]